MILGRVDDPYFERVSVEESRNKGEQQEESGGIRNKMDILNDEPYLLVLREDVGDVGEDRVVTE